jgi:hypothetical protein
MTLLTTTTGDAAMIDTEIAALQAQKKGIEDRIRLLRTRRNSLSRLCGLAPEVLYWIFTQIIDDRDMQNTDIGDALGVSSRGYNGSFRSMRAWWALSVTCTYLRAFAIASPLLWASVNLNGHLDWIHLLVERARHVSLSLQYFEGCTPTAFVTEPDDSHMRRELLLELSRRARHIIVYTADAQTRTCFEECLSIDNRSLQSLVYRTHGPAPIVLSSIYAATQAMSTLTHLDVGMIGLSSAPPELPVLSSLKIGESLFPEHVVGWLQRVPSLKELYIEDRVRESLTAMIQRKGAPLVVLARLEILCAPLT